MREGVTMVFANFTEAQWFLLGTTFVIALIMGAVVNKTNFCTMGAVSDWVNMGDTGRFRAWLLAMAIAIIGALLLEGLGVVNLSDTFPGYRGSNFIWLQNILGGVLFGIGMTLGSGCANKNLVRIGGGNIKAVFVVVVMGIFAYFMIFPFPGSSQTLMSLVFLPWMQSFNVQLATNQDLGSLVSAHHALTARLWIGGILAAGLLAFIFKSRDFRGSFDNILGGLIVGLAVVAAWYFSGIVHVKGLFDTVTLRHYIENWGMMDNPTHAVKPIRSAFMGTQSFTFVNPAGQAMGYIGHGLSKAFWTFGLVAFAGVIIGSLLWSLVTRSFRIEWFASVGDFVKHVVGAMLMGVGGVLALGCTIGQGVTGVSTLAVGSFLALASIIFGSALTMKVQLYKMVYEDASFAQVLLTSLVDMRLLPKAMRRLEAV